MIAKSFPAWLVALSIIATGTLAQEHQTAAAAPVPPQLEWTANPGAFEQSLQRRHGNPLFAPSRRAVDEGELRAAVIRDAAEAREALDEFMNLALQQRKLVRLDDPAEIDAAVASFEKQIRRARGIGGEAAKLADELQRIRGRLIATWREKNADADEVLVELDEIEEALQRLAPVENSAFVAQLLRDDSPIEGSDLAPAMLGEDPDTIRLAMGQLDPALQQLVRRGALAVVSTVRLEGAQIEGFGQRLRALNEAPPPQPN